MQSDRRDDSYERSLKDKSIQTGSRIAVSWSTLLLLRRFSRVWLCATPWTAAHQALSSLGFSRQEHWSGLPFLSSWSMREHQIQTANAKSGSYWDDGSVNWIVVVVKLSKFTETYWIIHLKHVHVMICTLYLNQENQLIIKIHNDLRSFCLVILLCPFILLLVKHFFSISWLNMYL